MKILKVLPNDIDENCPEVEQLRRHGHEVEVMRPAFWSAFTAATIASRLKTFDAGRVETERLKDAVAAVSARKLASGKNFEIAVRVPRNSVKWPHADRLDTSGVAWIYPSERLKSEFGRPGAVETLDVAPGEDFRHDPETVRYAFFGYDAPATYLRLKEAVEAIAANPDATLDVYGEFRARHVMPVVRRCKALEIGNRVRWHGKDFIFDQAVLNADRIFLSQYEPTDAELLAASFGRILIDKI